MSKNNICSKRFKGVENFLRRVAFNLGNTPSQTEVKIISCIPIDVTDLQQKIIQLERQLEERDTKAPTAVHTALLKPPNFATRRNAACSCKTISCQSISSVPKHSRFVEPKSPKALSGSMPDNSRGRAYLAMNNTEVRKRSDFSKNFFMKRKKFLGKKKCTSQTIYYAQSEVKNPFSINALGDDWSSKNIEEKESFDSLYFTKMVRKQYKPVVKEPNSSEFSTPICRDILSESREQENCLYESDMCSCCHGPFKNVDNHMTKHNFDIPLARKNSYYDSNLYDVVPVKENAVKVKNGWPEEPQCSYKVLPTIVNYHTTRPTHRFTRKAHIQLLNRKEKVLNKMARNKPIICKPARLPIKSCSVEFGEVYAKRLNKTRQKIPKSTPNKVTKMIDAACLTALASRECQTTLDSDLNSQDDKKDNEQQLPLPEDKTEVTLNQIKEILQSVLAEVKTNSKINNIPEQEKKDAVVQNGLSQSNIYGGSSLLHSFTYSPHNMDPYSPTCSQQIDGNYCHQNVPNGQIKYTQNLHNGQVTCMQHYPLFVQPGRNSCIGCYKNNPQIQQPRVNRAPNAGTNTERFQTRSKETENLIKEIYKSVALNIEIPTIDKPVKERSTINKVISKYNIRTDAQHATKNISEIYKNTKTIETPLSNTPQEHASTETASQIKPVTNSSHSTRKECDTYYNNMKGKHFQTVHGNEAEEISQQLESDEESDNTMVNESESETPESETETENETEIIEPEKKKEKVGIFSKMMKVFKPSTRNLKKATKGGKEDQSDSDSDDYQTVYSHKVTSPKPAHRTVKSKVHSKVFYTKQPQQKPRTLPPIRNPRKPMYMEQEYRRCFDEQLMFHDGRNQRSTNSTYYQKKPIQTNQRNQTLQATMMQNSKNDSYVLQGESNLPASRSFVHPKAISWLKKHKVGIHCGEQWKNFILEN